MTESAAIRKAMVYHVPFLLNPDAKTASGIRPVKMRQAFEDLGYDVLEISGHARERAAAFARLRRAVKEGARFEFVYSEAATLPTALTGPSRLPTHPFLDYRIFAFCKRHGIPVGVFYRDIYWNFPEYTRTVHRVVALGTRTFYRLDLLAYRTLVSRIFLPSMRMAAEMPLTRVSQCRALPPGSDVVESPVPDGKLGLFYVGGLGAYYRLHECVAAVADSADATMILCTRPQQWEAHRAEYEPLLGGRTTVVHDSGAALQQHYDRASLGVLFLEPIPYREFAAPLKLYEYLAQGKPVIAAQGSLAGEFVQENGVGWVLPYRAAGLRDLLERLAAHPEEYEAVRNQVLATRESHTWAARAAQVEEDLVSKQLAPAKR
ncbi:glycosyltransferase family protein [Specibacter cremeus]|uniref:glycosyltransferase family protein n=1 Tax=Specibacter cremeus TaxID=1629051 RepID=UPI000F792D19|nr:glycosyltransferase [Specibacter cremeus]